MLGMLGVFAELQRAEIRGRTRSAFAGRLLVEKPQDERPTEHRSDVRRDPAA